MTPRPPPRIRYWPFSGSCNVWLVLLTCCDIYSWLISTSSGVTQNSWLISTPSGVTQNIILKGLKVCSQRATPPPTPLRWRAAPLIFDGWLEWVAKPFLPVNVTESLGVNGALQLCMVFHNPVSGSTTATLVQSSPGFYANVDMRQGRIQNFPSEGSPTLHGKTPSYKFSQKTA